MDSQPNSRHRVRTRCLPDRRAMRPRISGTVARGEWYANPIVRHGTIAVMGHAIPVEITQTLLQKDRRITA
jgi:hypothetical protein